MFHLSFIFIGFGIMKKKVVCYFTNIFLSDLSSNVELFIIKI